MADKKFNIKDQLAGVAALIAAIVAIGGGFVKYAEITTKLDAIEAREQVVVNTTSIETSIAVLEEKIIVSEGGINTNTATTIDNVNLIADNDKGVAINSNEIELLKIQIEEIKVSTSNPLSN